MINKKLNQLTQKFFDYLSRTLQIDGRHFCSIDYLNCIKPIQNFVRTKNGDQNFDVLKHQDFNEL